MKDYYDLYLLTKTNDNIDIEKVALAIEKTMQQRNNLIKSSDYNAIIDFLRQSNVQNNYWSTYARDAPYAEEIKFNKVMDQIKFFSNKLIELET